jgi:hypothetical protein
VRPTKVFLKSYAVVLVIVSLILLAIVLTILTIPPEIILIAVTIPGIASFILFRQIKIRGEKTSAKNRGTNKADPTIGENQIPL